MNCCSNCFNDEFLSKQIKDLSKQHGDCDYCKTKNIETINPIELSDYFQPLIDLYNVSDEGKFLVDLLKKDWVLFLKLEIDLANQLIEDILETKFDNLYIQKKNDESGILNWQEFKNELKHINRYFPIKAPSHEHLRWLFDNLILPNYRVPNYLYRARINEDENPVTIDYMGKPPAKISTAGRANPIGIPYLYTASNISTAIAEIRPHKGDSVTVAKFDILEPLKLADLRNPRQSISPFTLKDEDELNQIYLDLDYLCHLGEELSKPILPREAHLEYLSSQYLCELIKHCGFDGVVYKSSVGDGDNFAIFYDEKLKASEVECYQVNNVNFDFDII